ncbi:MAG: hypothetical protein KC496_10665, partial [Anaerolineae bacterium]|nr:hypothetical protein [Anaerolineae bacterium]
QPSTIALVLDQQNVVGDRVALPIVATDPEAGTVRYSTDWGNIGETLPAGLAIDPLTGLVTGIVVPDALNLSPYTVIVTVIDDHGLQTSIAFTWTIEPQAQVTDVPATVVPTDIVPEGTQEVTLTEIAPTTTPEMSEVTPEATAQVEAR